MRSLGQASSSEADHISYALIGGFLFVLRTFPFLQVPDFEAAFATDEGNLAFQAQLPAKILRQDEATLFVRRTVLRARV